MSKLYNPEKNKLAQTTKVITDEVLEVMENARNKLDEHVGDIDIKPYSHNIVSIVLLGVASKIGTDYANQLIDDYNLEELGWKKVDGKMD